MKVRVNDKVIEIPQKFEAGDSVRIVGTYHPFFKGPTVFTIQYASIDIKDEDEVIPALEVWYYDGDGHGYAESILELVK